MKNLLAALLLGTMVAALSACGSGGGDGGGAQEGSEDVLTPAKTFALTLEGIDVRRASNDEPVEIHISGIESGVLRLGP